MRTRFFFLAASVTSLAAAAVAQGCGETETTSTPADAGTDVADTGAKKETGPPPEEDAATCDLSHDFTADIPDAEISDGASTTGLCVGCGNSHCKKYIEQCNLNCQCQGLAAEALECYAKNSGDLAPCVASLASSQVSKETQQIGFALFSCLNEACKDECQTEQFNDAGSDSGPKDAGDGG